MPKQKWTSEQLEAINYRGANLLVAAGAGSGKTSVLVERVLRLIGVSRSPTTNPAYYDHLPDTDNTATTVRIKRQDTPSPVVSDAPSSIGLDTPPPISSGTSPITEPNAPLPTGPGTPPPVGLDKLLIVTFTTAAAAEMKERIAVALTEELDELETRRFEMLQPTASGSGVRSGAACAGATAAAAAAAAADQETSLRRQLILLDSAAISTIHSFCHSVIKDNINLIDGLDSGFRLMDDAEASLLRADALDDVLEERYADENNAAFADLVESYGMGRDDRNVAAVVLRTYNFSQGAPWPAEWLNQMTAMFKINNGTEFCESIWARRIIESLTIELDSLTAVLHRYGDTVIECIKSEDARAEAVRAMAEIAGLRRLCAEASDAGGGIDWSGIRDAVLGLGDMACLCPRAARGEDPERKIGREAVKAAVRSFSGNFINRFFRFDFEDIKEEFMRSYVLLSELSSVVGSFARHYTELKLSRAVVDFNDLEHYAIRILLTRDCDTGRCSPTEAAYVYRSKFAEVLVDEYQDINLVQEYIIQAVSGGVGGGDGNVNGNGGDGDGDSYDSGAGSNGGGGLFMVGDVKQSIYRFRQAMPEIFMEKYLSYRTLSAGDSVSDETGCSDPSESGDSYKNKSEYSGPGISGVLPGIKILLYKNFRSNSRILDFINIIFGSIMSKNAGELDYTEEEWLRSGISDGERRLPENTEAGADADTLADTARSPVEIHIISKKPPEMAISGSYINVNNSSDAPINNSAPPQDTSGKDYNDAGDMDDSADIGSGAEVSGAGSSSSDTEQDDVEMEDISNAELEARFIADRIDTLMRGTRVPEAGGGTRALAYGDIAVLMRATKASAPALCDELIRLGIPAYSETGASYFEKYEITVMLSLLKIIDNPLQDIPLFTVMLSPIFLFTAEEAALIRIAASPLDNAKLYDEVIELSDDDAAIDNFVDGAYRPSGHKPLYYCLLECAEQNVFNKQITLAESTVEKARAAVAAIGGWRRLSAHKPVSALIWELMHETGFYMKVCAMPGGEQRRANLLKLFEYARTYEKISYKSIYNFIRFVDRMIEQGDSLAEANLFGQNANSVRIMSIHKSKGLEFPIVFLAGCGKSFNLRDSSDQLLLHRDAGFGPNYVDLRRRIIDDTIAKKLLAAMIRNEALSEEMRILYVALTRAKNNLFLVGTLPDVDRYRQRLENLFTLYKNTDNTDIKCPSEYVLKADKYLFWIISALKSNVDYPIYFHSAAEFTDAEQINAPANTAVTADSSGIIHDGNHIIGDGLANLTKINNNANDSNVQAIHIDTQPLPDDFEEKLNERLSWTYPYEWLSHIPRKITVTDIVESRTTARLFTGEIGETGEIDETDETDEIEDEYVYGFNDIIDDINDKDKDKEPDPQRDFFAIPKFLAGVQGFSKAQIGTFTHLVLEKADFKRDSNPEALEEFIKRLIDNKTLLPEQADVVERRAILNFFGTEAGRLAAAADKLNRETMFTVRLSLSEYAELTHNPETAPYIPTEIPPEISPGASLGAPPGKLPVTPLDKLPGTSPGTPPGASPGTPPDAPFVLMQGSIDCWFDTPEGMVLIDYKTGFSAEKDIADVQYSKYRRQIELYALALKKITGQNVHRKFLCLLSTGGCVEI